MKRIKQSKSAARQFLLLDTLVGVVMAVMREHAISWLRVNLPWVFIKAILHLVAYC